MVTYMSKVTIILAFFLLTACSIPKVSQPIDTKVFYRRDLKITVNGKSGVGVMVAPKASSYKISGEAFNDTGLVAIQTVHRGWESQDLEDKKFSYTLIPQTSAEEFGLVRIAGLDEKGQNSWAEFAIEDGEIGAVSRCNGEVFEAKTTFCQAPAQTVQEIEFTEEVFTTGAQACDYQLSAAKAKKFSYTIPAKNCGLIFMNAEGKYHRLYSAGYEGAYLRKKE